MSQERTGVEHEKPATMQYILRATAPQNYLGTKRDYSENAFNLPDHNPTPIIKTDLDLTSNLYSSQTQQKVEYLPLNQSPNYQGCSGYHC